MDIRYAAFPGADAIAATGVDTGFGGLSFMENELGGRVCESVNKETDESAENSSENGEEDESEVEEGVERGLNQLIDNNAKFG